MNWQDIVQRDPFLAGYLAAREYAADSLYLADTGEIEIGQPTIEQVLQPFVSLSLEQQARFTQGWNQGQTDSEQERREQRTREYDAMAKGYDKGDPAAR